MARTPSNMIELGSKAPDFKLVNTIDNKLISSNDFYNQPVGDPYVPPTGGDFGIEPPSPATSYSSQPTYTPPPSKSVHTVSKGDTLYSISRNYGTTVAALRQANGINGSLIRIGERIMIP